MIQTSQIKMTPEQEVACLQESCATLSKQLVQRQESLDACRSRLGSALAALQAASDFIHALQVDDTGLQKEMRSKYYKAILALDGRTPSP